MCLQVCPNTIQAHFTQKLLRLIELPELTESLQNYIISNQIRLAPHFFHTQNQRENSHIYIKPITYHTIQYLNSIPNFPKSTQSTDQNLKTRFLKPNIQNSTLHQNTRDQFQTLISPTEYQKQRIKRKSRRNTPEAGNITENINSFFEPTTAAVETNKLNEDVLGRLEILDELDPIENWRDVVEA
ncbi:hypothetical protein G4B88_025899 [Cannabis sativa]|uniref:Uncharacterized protein n=1 Tax=Cannabis sativa TaxID=3483 RepID=A0A7J6HHR8_CANSA|nr:hypothetical protein G4B88_025899 [Cannabis sativa]